MQIETKLEELGLALPEPAKPPTRDRAVFRVGTGARE